MLGALSFADEPSTAEIIWSGVLRHPSDETGRLAWADAMDEKAGRALGRTHHVRCAIALAERPFYDPTTFTQQHQQMQYWKRHGLSWTDQILNGPLIGRMRRGFAEIWDIHADDFFSMDWKKADSWLVSGLRFSDSGDGTFRRASDFRSLGIGGALLQFLTLEFRGNAPLLGVWNTLVLDPVNRLQQLTGLTIYATGISSAEATGLMALLKGAPSLRFLRFVGLRDASPAMEAVGRALEDPSALPAISYLSFEGARFLGKESVRTLAVWIPKNRPMLVNLTGIPARAPQTLEALAATGATVLFGPVMLVYNRTTRSWGRSGHQFQSNPLYEHPIFP
jgi:uncharacterized protein (TIGR02996 family)